jgi:hypothetical protein
MLDSTDGTGPHGVGSAKPAEDARQGESTGRMRWVLGTSLGGAIILMIVLYYVV